MSQSGRKEWLTTESWFLALGIAHIIRTSRDEKTAVRRICRRLHLYGILIRPRELGSQPEE